MVIKSPQLSQSLTLHPRVKFHTRFYQCVGMPLPMQVPSFPRSHRPSCGCVAVWRPVLLVKQPAYLTAATLKQDTSTASFPYKHIPSFVIHSSFSYLHVTLTSLILLIFVMYLITVIETFKSYEKRLKETTLFFLYDILLSKHSPQ